MILRLCFALIAGMMMLESLAFAQNVTTIGTLTLTPTFDNIGVKLTYTGDANSSNSATLQFRPTGGGAWRNAHTASVSTTAHWPDRRSTSNGVSNTANQNQFRASIVGLTAGATYDIQLTLTDADGITGTNPVTGSVTMLDPATMVVQSGTTKYLDTNAAGGGDGSSGTPYNTWSAAQTGTSCGDTLNIKATSGASAGVTFSKSCTSTTWYKIVCADQSVAAFSEGASTTPNLSITGDYLKIENCRFAAGSDTIIDLSSTPSNIWLDQLYIVDAVNAHAGLCSGSVPYDAAIRVNQATNFTLTNSQLYAPTLAAGGGCSGDGSDGHGRAVFFGSSSGGGGRHIIKGNTFGAGFTDTIGNSPESSANILDNSDVLNNTFAGCFDDCIQMEGSAINLRIGWNTITATNANNWSCFAMTTSYFGPIYAYRNYCLFNPSSGGTAVLKYGGTENSFWLHNTFRSNKSGGYNIYYDTDSLGTEFYITAINNIFQTNQSATISRMDATGTTFNYNLHWRVSGTPYIEDWNNTITDYNSLALFCSGVSQECNGIQQDPLLDGSLHIGTDSPAYDAGTTIANFNDANSTCVALNGAPDIGAYEVGGCAAGATGSTTIFQGGSRFIGSVWIQ